MVKDSISADLKGLGPLGMEFKIAVSLEIAALQHVRN